MIETQPRQNAHPSSEAQASTQPEEAQASTEPQETRAADSAPAGSAKGDVFDDLWRLFASPKLALGLILAITAACLAGALIMQTPSEMLGNADAMRTWVERARPKFGLLTDLFATLGIFWVFQSVWFRALLGLLALNTVICTLNRLPTIWRQVFEPRVRPGEGLFERGQPREMVRLASGPLDAAVQPVRAALRRRGYRVVEQVEPQGVYLYADRFRLARFGTLLSHAGLVLVLLGATASEPLGFFQEPAFAVPVGSTREVGHDTGLSLRVDDFADEYYPDGRPKDYRSDVVLFDQGREVARATVRVNEPLAYNGVRFHQAYYGQAAIVSATEPGGKSLFRDAVALTWRSNDGERPVGYFFLPTRDLHVYLVGTAGEGDPVVRPGELLVEAYRGSVATPTYRSTLTQRRPLKIGDAEFLFERELPFTGLRVVRDPGAPIVWLACVLMVLGFMLAFYLPHRRLWARIRAESGGAGVTLVGAGREMAEELRRVAEDFGFRISDFGLRPDLNPKSEIRNPKSEIGAGVMRLKELLVLGGLFGFVLVGAWFLVLRPAAPPSPAPTSLPPDIARLLEQLTPNAREAYAFALERPDVLQYIPCYCGCGEGGHTSNRSCFVKPTAGGGVTLESHGST